MALTEDQFEGMAEALLGRLAEAVEAAEADGVDVELQGPVLTIEVEDRGTFVVSKHAPTRQIWLSSPISGASHYAFDGQAWRSTRDQTALLPRLAAELGQAAGLELDLD
jgi:frataxin